MRILLAEDSKVYRHLVASCLREWGFEVVVAQDGSEAWVLLQQPDAPRLALLDWVLPGVDGVELCRRIRRRDATEPYIYTLLLTAKSEKQDLLEAMQAGVDDFLTKPFDPPELRARLLAAHRILDVQEQLVKARESYRIAATHDSLTLVWNRAEILDFLEREMSRARRSKMPLGVVLVDIDHFKAVNDSAGHLAGDMVLKDVAQRMRSGLRIYDGVGRYGGEEFLLVLPGCDLESTTARADELRAKICAQPILIPDRSISVTVSMGTALADPSMTLEAVLQAADVALYSAKRRGRNRVESQLREPVAGSSR